MANSSSQTNRPGELQPESKEPTNWNHAKEGLALWLNNLPDEAEKYFQCHNDHNSVLAGYTLVTCMNSVMSFELDRMEAAQVMLKELERRCESGDNGWMRSVRGLLFGGGNGHNFKSLADSLEEQIILADTQLLSAILTLLAQDLSGFVRGSWLLRKAWKIYQHTYNQIYAIYVKICKSEPFLSESTLNTLCNGLPLNIALSLRDDRSEGGAGSKTNLYSPDFDSTDAQEFAESPSHCGRSIAKSVSTFEMTPRTSVTPTPSSPSSSSSKSNSFLTKIRRSISMEHHNGRGSRFDIRKSSSANLRNGLSSRELTKNEIDPMEIKRLMGAVSFGYGMFQLCLSMLSPNLLKLISFLGFEGDRQAGISCLMYSRSSDDMRAPLATLALLWFYTIGLQVIAFDGSSLRNEIEAAGNLLTESRRQYGGSAIFLFYEGRLERLKSNLAGAVMAYERACQVSAQPEIKLICLHEIGWCRLIQLDYSHAMNNFEELRKRSQFSRSFYVYLTAICAGAHGRFENLFRLRDELNILLSTSPQKEMQIEKFLSRRLVKLPTNAANNCSPIYFRYLVFEMLCLWNSLGSCGGPELESIIQDCSVPMELLEEPTPGLARCIVGSCETYRDNCDAAISAYQQCLSMCSDEQDPGNQHVVSMANFELAMLFIRYRPENKSEARRLLLTAQTYKSYDFENRLANRINAALKKLNNM